LSKLKAGELVDLAAAENGGVPLACSDMFFSSMNNLIMPGRSANMGDGWETKRRRGPGNDWIILKLGLPGTLRKIEVDTNHFKGNYPDMCSIDGCAAPGASTEELTSADSRWREILPKTKLQANTRHFFEHELSPLSDSTHVRLNIYPDGGVSRLRLWGSPASAPGVVASAVAADPLRRADSRPAA
jgi:allantoicase